MQINKRAMHTFLVMFFVITALSPKFWQHFIVFSSVLNIMLNINNV